MAYDPKLLERIRAVLAGRHDIVEKKMFGSVAFMVRGKMACGPHKETLIVRIGEQAVAKAMNQPYVKPMDFTGKVLKSFATIEPNGIRTEAQLRRWVQLAIAYAASLPSVKAKARTRRRTTRKTKPSAR